MPYTVREKDGKWEVVKPDGTVYRSYPSREYAEDRAEDLQERDDARSHRSAVDDRLSRVATKDLSDEEIVAKYRAGEFDRLKAEEVTPPQPTAPPPPPVKEVPNPSAREETRRKGYWDRYSRADRPKDT